MAAEPSTLVTQVQPLVEKALTVARAAEAIARRLVGKVRGLCLIGALSAAWLAYFLTARFEFGLPAALSSFALLAIPALVLWWQYATLSDMIGLPERVMDTSQRVVGKTQEFRQMQATSTPRDQGAKSLSMREMWSTAKTLLEVKQLSDDARKIVSVVGGALVVGNPVFYIVLVIVGVVAVVLGLIALVTALIHVF